MNVFSVAERGEPLLPWISEEAAGVGGRLGRGMLSIKVPMRGCCAGLNGSAESQCWRGRQLRLLIDEVAGIDSSRAQSQEKKPE